MKGQKVMKGLSFINPKYIHEGEFESISTPEKSTHSHRKLVALILAACLVFSHPGWEASFPKPKSRLDEGWRHLPRCSLAELLHQSHPVCSGEFHTDPVIRGKQKTMFSRCVCLE